MKRILLSLMAVSLSIVILTACTNTNEKEHPTTTIGGGTTTTSADVGVGGDSFDYAAPYNLYFYLPQGIVNLVPKEEYEQWKNTFADEEGTRNVNDRNVYTFLKEFSVSRETVEDLCKKYKEAIPDTDYYTDEQIEMLYTGTELEVYQYFSNPYAVMVGKYAYAPKWMVEHTAEEYAAEGITYAVMSEKMDKMLSVCNEKQQDHLRTQLAALKELEE